MPLSGETPRVLVDATPLDTEHQFRGIGRYVRGLLQGFEESGFAAMYLRQSRSTFGFGGRCEITQESVWCKRPRKPRLRYDYLWNELWLPSEIRGTGASLFHSTDPTSLALRSHVPTVATVYDLIPLVFPKYLNRMPYLQRKGYLRYLESLTKVTHLIAISESTKADLTKYLQIDPSRISAIPLGVSEPVHNGELVSGHSEVEPSQIDQPYVLFAGALEEHKGVEFLLQAIRDVQVRLVIVGRHSPEQVSELDCRATELGIQSRLDYRGHVADGALDELYRGATAFVFPSLYEGFGLPLLEAMARGCPVITTSSSSIPEVVGDAAILVPARDPGSLARAIESLLHSDTARCLLVRAGKDRVRLFTWRSCATQTVAVYTRLLEAAL
jgi:glycosyltransferase involved in cell wall biosynthesis